MKKILGSVLTMALVLSLMMIPGAALADNTDVSGQVAETLEPDQLPVPSKPIECLVEQSGLAPRDPKRHQQQGLGIDRPAIDVPRRTTREADLGPLPPQEGDDPVRDPAPKPRDRHPPLRGT